MHRVWLAVVLLVAAGCAGDGPEAGEPDPTPAAPRLELPYDLAIDAEGHVYVADGLLRRVLRHDPETGETVVVAGTGEAGSTGDGGPAREATLEEPLGLALDDTGNLYVVDFPAGRIRRIVPGGTITTVADGLELPAAAAVDPTGRYLAVPTLGNYVLRIELETGQIETVAGDPPVGRRGGRRRCPDLQPVAARARGSPGRSRDRGRDDAVPISEALPRPRPGAGDARARGPSSPRRSRDVPGRRRPRSPSRYRSCRCRGRRRRRGRPSSTGS